MCNSVEILPGNTHLRTIGVTVVEPDNPTGIGVYSGIDLDTIVTELVVTVNRPQMVRPWYNWYTGLSFPLHPWFARLGTLGVVYLKSCTYMILCSTMALLPEACL